MKSVTKPILDSMALDDVLFQRRVIRAMAIMDWEVSDMIQLIIAEIRRTANKDPVF